MVKDRPPRVSKYSVTSESESELAESSDEASSVEDEAVCSWSGISSKTSTIAKSVGKAWIRALFVVATHGSSPPDYDAWWNEYKTRSMNGYQEVDDETPFGLFKLGVVSIRLNVEKGG